MARKGLLDLVATPMRVYEISFLSPAYREELRLGQEGERRIRTRTYGTYFHLLSSIFKGRALIQFLIRNCGLGFLPFHPSIPREAQLVTCWNAFMLLPYYSWIAGFRT